MMKCVRCSLGTTLAFLTIAGAHTAAAQNTISAPVVVASAGNTSVAVIFSATTTKAVNVLSFTVSFDPALCGMIKNEKLLQNGRSQVAPQEAAGCSPTAGQLTLAVLNLSATFSCNDDPSQFCDTNAQCIAASRDPLDFCSAAIPAGTGGIVKWQFDVLPGATGGVFPLTVTVNQAKKGPIDLTTFTATTGQLTIVGSAPACPGDCNGDGQVSVDEIVTGVGIALGNAPLSVCPAFDLNHDGSVSVDEIIAAVNAALNRCP
jgi:hypothetical protein